MAPPPPFQLTLRSASNSPSPAVELSVLNVPPEYQLAPTVPPPFARTLIASLDAILVFNSIYPQLHPLTNPLLQKVDRKTNWVEICYEVLEAHEDKPAQGRYLLVEFLFLITRTLLPEQVAENRKFMYRMYLSRRNLSTRVMLRYDMLRNWKKRSHAHPIIIESVLPHDPPVRPILPLYNKERPHRRPLMQNILSTLIAARPDEPYCTKKMSDCMRHHVTDLDRYLLLTDEEVEEMGTIRLIMMLVEVVVQWQWIKENTELMEEMDVRMWEDMDGKADECEWVRDTKNVKEVGGYERKGR